MRIAALLTGRGNNTLKDKNVLPVLGRPLCQYPAMAAKNSKLIDDFYVSSDDEKILTTAEECGYKRIVRPAELALPTAQHVDAIIHALGIMKAEGIEPDILVVILANNAITKTEWIEESIRNLIDNPELSASCPVMLEQDHHPYRSKCLREDGCLGTWFDFNGRFAIYYRWMIYLPIVLSVLIVLNQERKFRKTEYTLYSITTIILMALGIHSFNTDTGLNKKVDDIDMNEFHHLMKSANIPQDSHIAGPFFSFYELKNNYTHCYFPQVYPTKFIKKLDYLVVYGENRYKKGFPLYGQASVINDLRELQNRNDVKLELVKEDKKNDIQLYHIH